MFWDYRLISYRRFRYQTPSPTFWGAGTPAVLPDRAQVGRGCLGDDWSGSEPWQIQSDVASATAAAQVLLPLLLLEKSTNTPLHVASQGCIVVDIMLTADYQMSPSLN